MLWSCRLPEVIRISLMMAAAGKWPALSAIFLLLSWSGGLCAQVPALPPGSDHSDHRERITWDHVYGSRQIKLVPQPFVDPVWISDDQYLLHDADGWNKTEARSGSVSPWYDVARLQSGLQKIDGISPDEAHRMADGGWTLVDNIQRVAVFEHDNTLIWITLDGEDAVILRNLPSNRELPSLSPTGSGVAFICHNDLWVADFQTATVRQLTADASESVRNGKADWVYFEEIYNRRWDAFRWSPDGRKLMFQQFDDTDVSRFQVTNHTTVEPVVETEFFPKAGESNPIVRLGVVAMEGGPVVWLDTSQWPADDLLITNFQWSPEGNDVLWYAQNRIQTHLDIVRSSAVSGASALLLRDQTEAWVDNPGPIRFLNSGRFLLFSERTGWRHLYRVSADGKFAEPLTFGNWEVRSLLAVSEDQSWAIVTGTMDSPVAENIYRVSLDPARPDAVRLSQDDGHHAANVSPHGRLFIDSFSTLNQPTAVVLRDSSGAEVRRLQEPAVVPSDRYQLGQVQLRQLPMADGSQNAAVFILPPDFDETRRYPIWLMTYGGPHYPIVKDAWNPRMFEHLLAGQGIVVIRFDPRSASGYGARSAWLAWRQLGVEETRDIVAVCDWLAAQQWVDAGRIGLSGYSYGGFLTAYAMTHCNRLCAGIAGAPVTDWANYDTIYTERYMSTPQENPEGYRKSSVVRAAGDLQGRLLLLHGMMDDNVHPANSLQLVHELQKTGRDFEVMFYPTARHGITGSHYERLNFSFIMKSLGLAESLPD